MFIQDFAAKVDAVRRSRGRDEEGAARVAKALGVGYHVTLPFAAGTETFVLKGDEVGRLLAEFPGVEALWKLFRRESIAPQTPGYRGT
jgi:hypothetical protein